MNTQIQNKDFNIILPSSGRGKKEFDLLFKRRKKQTIKAINKLKKYPTDYRHKGIEEINNRKFGEYTIRVSKGDRIFYDVDLSKKQVHILHAGLHDYYKLLK